MARKFHKKRNKKPMRRIKIGKSRLAKRKSAKSKRRIKTKIKIRTRKKIGKANETKGAVGYLLNRDFQFIQELRDLILKSSPAEKEEIIAKLNKIGKIQLAVMAGVFLNKENQENMQTDLFVVSDNLDRRKFNKFLRHLEAEIGGEVRFAVMEKDEFAYRLSMFDRFIRVLLEGPHEKLINRLGI